MGKRYPEAENALASYIQYFAIKAAEESWRKFIEDGDSDEIVTELSARMAKSIKSRLGDEKTLLYFLNYGSNRDFDFLKLEEALRAENFNFERGSTQTLGFLEEARILGASPQDLEKYQAKNILICHKRIIPEDLVAGFNLCLQVESAKNVYLATPLDFQGAANFCYFKAFREPYFNGPISFLKTAGPKTHALLEQKGLLSKLTEDHLDFVVDFYEPFMQKIEEVFHRI